jgi:4'-phosphopantetheinyl transferase EntD
VTVSILDRAPAAASPAPGLADLLSHSACAQAYADVASGSLPRAERRAVAGAVLQRRREFATARHCARQALAALGAPAVPLPPDPDRLPKWPAGVVGSLTHCAGYRGAAVAWRHEVHAVGIDAEPHAPLPAGVAGLVLTEDERSALTGPKAGDLHLDRLAFCAKEAVYKAWFPLTRRWLEFTDVALTVRLDGTFLARVLVPDARAGDVDLGMVAGRWTVARGLVLAAVEIAGDRPSGVEAA